MDASSMRACVYYEYGGPEVLRVEAIPAPEPGPGQAIVRVHAAGVNAFDLMARSGRYKPNPGFPHILGADFGGEVAALGPDATGPKLTLIGSNSATKRELEGMMPLVRAGKLRPVVDREFSLEEAPEAHRYLEGRRHFGKVILRVQ